MIIGDGKRGVLGIADDSKDVTGRLPGICRPGRMLSYEGAMVIGLVHRKFITCQIPTDAIQSLTILSLAVDGRVPDGGHKWQVAAT